jgi:hypothetical protein
MAMLLMGQLYTDSIVLQRILSNTIIAEIISNNQLSILATNHAKTEPSLLHQNAVIELGTKLASSRYFEQNCDAQPVTEANNER